MIDFMNRYRPPGAPLAVTKDARLVYACGFGYADAETKTPVEPLSLFRIASLSKAFTATRDYVTRQVLQPLGITRMRLGKNLLRDRAPGEGQVLRRHGPRRTRHIGAEYRPAGAAPLRGRVHRDHGRQRRLDRLRFIDAFNDIRNCRLLDERSIRTMLARPPGAPGLTKGKPGTTYYGCGWEDQTVAGAKTKFVWLAKRVSLSRP
jgi:CubicO group peptidase (beta-lactamase class C family)